MPLTGPQIDSMAQVISAAYDRDGLRRVLTVCMEENLEDLVADKKFTAQVFDLVVWASRQDRWLELLRCAYENNKTNDALRKLWADLAGDQARPLPAAAYDIFLSYSHYDKPRAWRIKSDLEQAGFTVWTDEGLAPGTQDWPDAIEGAVKRSKCMVVAMSPRAKASRWVRIEVDLALDWERPLFPVLLEGERKDAVLTSLRDLQYADVHTDYTGGMERQLLPALRGLLGAGSATPPHQPQDAPPARPAIADLEIHVVRREPGNRLAFVLNSDLPAVPFRSQPVGEVMLRAQDPQSYIAGRLQRLSDLSVITLAEEEAARTWREVESLGAGFFEQLLPAQLQELYWTQIKPLHEQGIIQSLLIVSDEYWIPWELIKPYRWDDASGTEQYDDFLVAQFSFSRSPNGSGVPDLPIATIALVMPDLGLQFVEQEKDCLTNLAGQKRFQLAGPLQLRYEVLDSLRNGGFQILHVASHANPELNLADGTIGPDDVVAGALRGLRIAKPLVFFNTGTVWFSGWPEKLIVEARARAFISPLFTITDELASAFACSFYAELSGGAPLGEALRSARAAVRILGPANPAWLAYALIGDPNMNVLFAGHEPNTVANQPNPS
ncbi:MAG: TIR domain-containing protein [Caldilineaceae bacterium]